jgi:23S rRNA (pseudouridine1915-N3)-methyltransferase
MKEMILVTVGKLKDPRLESLEKDYLKRLKAPLLKIIEVKASAENPSLEAKEVLQRIHSLSSRPWIVLLGDNGKKFDGAGFAKLIRRLGERNDTVFFVIGGAHGHGPEVSAIANETISLSELTFPHKLARLIFVEQYYRAQTVLSGHPYHH